MAWTPEAVSRFDKNQRTNVPDRKKARWLHIKTSDLSNLVPGSLKEDKVSKDVQDLLKAGYLPEQENMRIHK